MRDFQIVGLTGPTGSGKSTVSRFFEQAGYTVINADEIARDVTSAGSPCVQQLALAFGSEILLPDGSLDRRKLAGAAFSSPENTRLLNDITHPRIFLKVLEKCREYIDGGSRYILFDAPVLFESNSDLMCDSVVCVTAPRSVRESRLVQRDGLPLEAVRRRMNAQHEDAFYTSRSEFVIDGGAPLDEVEARTKAVIKELSDNGK